MKRVLLIFVDGIGVGPKNPATNPFSENDRRVLHITSQDPPQLVYDGRFKAIDASMGVPGLPQSATGQTAILTGKNAARIRGEHLRGFPDAKLKEIIQEGNILSEAAKAGLESAFADAYRPEFFKYTRLIPHSVTTAASLAAGLTLKNLDDVRSRRAIYHDLTNEVLREKGYDVPIFTPVEAAQILNSIVSQNHLTLFEFFQTDRAGHATDRERASSVIGKLDEFLDRLIGSLDLSETTVILTSDHGNLEDLTHPDHTENPVPLLTWGPGADELFSKAQSILDIAPFIREKLQIY